MRLIVFVMACLAAVNCLAESPAPTAQQLAQEVPPPTYPRCSCDFSIAENGGMRHQAIFFSPCDQSFALMMMDGHPTFFEPRGAPDPNRMIASWKSGLHEATLNIKKTGNGAEAEWFKGTLTVSRGKAQQVMEVIGACGW